MKEQLIQGSLSVRKSFIHGYGVFAEKNFVEDEIIEECYCLLTENRSEFLDYYFNAGKYSAIATGFGVIYNHSTYPNARFEYDSENQLLVFRANCGIATGEEILVSYGTDWFSCRKMECKKVTVWRKMNRVLARIPLRGLMLTALIFLVIKSIS